MMLLNSKKLVAVLAIIVAAVFMVVTVPAHSVHYRLSHCWETRTRISPTEILIEGCCESYRHDGSRIGTFCGWTVVEG